MTQRTRLFVTVLVFAVSLTMMMWAQAQTAAEAPEGRAVEAAVEVPEVTLWQMWKTGGFFMYPIALLSVAAAALTAFGFLNYREDRMMPMHLVPQLQESIRAMDFRTASSLCSGSPSIMTNILNAGLMRLSGTSLDIRSVEKAMEEAAIEENTTGLKPVNYLSIIASIAPMFGLLGTVSGMIKAFQKIGMGGMGDPERLASDIGEAMITTAFGLLIGIPAMFFYFYLKNKFTSNLARIGRLLGNITHEMEESFARAESGDMMRPAAEGKQAEAAGEGA